MSKKENTAETNLENVEHALGRSERFIEDNQKNITIFVLALVIVVGGYWAYKKLYMEPRNAEAHQSVFHAQNYFNNDQFQIALDGDGMAPGFLEVIDNYGNTQTGKLSKYYAGISYLHLGEFEMALDYLKGFKSSNVELQAIANGAMGDAHIELGNQEEALKFYDKAIDLKNELTAPFYLLKKGIVLEEMDNKAEALKAYQTIKDEYETSAEAGQIDKYITRASL
jgi:tetratricopeptide (TPR) repeat protein